MVSRVWRSTIQPPWTVTVVGGEPVSTVGESLGDLDDRGLVAVCVAGRRDAFDLLVRRHQRAVYQLCYRFVGNHEDASDLSQDVFLRAFRGLGTFRGQSSVGTWLYRIGVNVCLNRVTTKTPFTEPIDAHTHIDERSADPVAELLSAERASRVRAAILRLPPKQRAALILRVYHECSHQAIAGILGSSVGAVKANVFHALANLRRALESDSR